MEFKCNNCEFMLENYEFAEERKNDKVLNHYEEKHPEKKVKECIICGDEGGVNNKMSGGVILLFRYCGECFFDEEKRMESLNDMVRLGEWYDE